MKVLIHAYPKRMWYVNEYIVPSLVSAGVSPADIFVYNDEKLEGNLVSCMRSLLYYSDVFEGDNDIWSLQDDVIICKGFKERCESLSDHDIVMGYSGECEPEKHDKVRPLCKAHLWWSAPCMKMTPEIMRDISDFFWSRLAASHKYLLYHNLGKCDDVVINDYIADRLEKKKDGLDILQVSPSLVDHVDYLIGGSAINSQRTAIAKSKDFVDKDLVEELKESIERRKAKSNE